jgi:hypothetical protein
MGALSRVAGSGATVLNRRGCVAETSAEGHDRYDRCRRTASDHVVYKDRRRSHETSNDASAGMNGLFADSRIDRHSRNFHVAA